MLFSDITIINQEFEAQEHCYVGVRDDRIAYVGTVAPQEDFGERYDGAGKVLMPGMYNAHAHAPMTLLRGYAENLPLQKWLFDKIFPFEALINDDRALPAMRLAIAEMLRYGTVSFSDMYFFNEARVQAIQESGVKCNLCHSISDFADTPYPDSAFYAINEGLIESYHGAFDGKLLIDLCLHSEYTTNPTIAAGVAESAKALGVGVQLHLSETASEHEECKQRHNGMTPAQYFEDLGLFDSPCTAAHCVWTEPEDWEIFVKHGVSVASCPVSNLKLASGVAPIPQMLAAGVNVALGTDGVASNNNHDMMQDMYLFALLHKGISGDPTAITPAQALACATVNGARSQQRFDCGVIKEGNKADLVVLDVNRPSMVPATNMVNNVVYSAHGDDVVLTMVDGQVLYRNGDWLTIDVERAQFETTAATQAILSEL